MMAKQNKSVQSFIRNVIRWIVIIPLWLFLAWPSFKQDWSSIFQDGSEFGAVMGPLFLGVVLTVLILWFAGVIARMFFILPQWERLVLLRMGTSVGARGPGFFVIPPFLYSVARIVDIRITTYEVKATKTLTMDNIPVDVTAAVELEVEDPEKATINVKDYWKTTEWSTMEALKNAIGSNTLKLLLSETEELAVHLKQDIDSAVCDYGVNVRAVRITDVAAPPSLIEELAVIARAERAAKAKQIQAEAEKLVARELAEAAHTLAGQSGTMELRQIQALLEMSKEESSMIIVYPMSSLGAGEQIAAATAGAHSKRHHKLHPPSPSEPRREHTQPPSGTHPKPSKPRRRPPSPSPDSTMAL